MSNNENLKKLSAHVEGIFKSFIAPGLHICDLATGGGKSYTLAKLSCEYYPKYFDRICILVPQKKMAKGMLDELGKVVSSPNSMITSNDILEVESHRDNVLRCLRDNTSPLDNLVNEINGVIIKAGKTYNVKKLESRSRKISKVVSRLKLLKEISLASKNSTDFENDLRENESYLRLECRTFFREYAMFLRKTKQYKSVSSKQIVKSFPSLVKVFPCADFESKKVLVMTTSKAMYGIDPILVESKTLTDLCKKKNTMFFFDESDQDAVFARNAIVDMSIPSDYDHDLDGYLGVLSYQATNEQYDTAENLRIVECLQKTSEWTKKIWKKNFLDTPLYKDIFLKDEEDIEDFRRGVFFCGSLFCLKISFGKNLKDGYVVYKRGDRFFSFKHVADENELKGYDVVMSLSKFLNLLRHIFTRTKSNYRKVIMSFLEENRKMFEREICDNTDGHLYMNYPTLESEAYSFFARCGKSRAEIQKFKRQILDFIRNRKNTKFIWGNNEINFPEETVYFQGFDFLFEEVDRNDNKHRMLFHKYGINTTPEKVIYNLLQSEKTSIVLCSATSSSLSVTSNFDIRYLRRILGSSKYHVISDDDKRTFDDLSALTNPKEHKIKVVPVSYEIPSDFDLDSAELCLPQNVRNMFCEEARTSGVCDTWFKISINKLKAIYKKDQGSIIYRLNNLLEFVKVYFDFWNNNDNHSCLYFQNRSAEKDINQYITIANLIEGSYERDYDWYSGLPQKWENYHLYAFTSMEQIESNILSKLEHDKNAKVMLISAYNSLKAGMNIQYKIADGLPCLYGESWTADETAKKDWDSIYLQSPTGFLLLEDKVSENDFLRDLLQTSLNLLMLRQRGCLSQGQVLQYLRDAISRSLKVSEKDNDELLRIKSAWAQDIVEQAVGRLCRTHNKPFTTTIYYDICMEKFFYTFDDKKSVTREFRALIEDMKSVDTGCAEIIKEGVRERYNKANLASLELRRMRDCALQFTPHAYESEYDIDDATTDEFPHAVDSAQKLQQIFKNFIIRNPVIENETVLDNYIGPKEFICNCYGDWLRDEEGKFSFNYNINFKSYDLKGSMHYISPESVRLDVLMRNDIIHDFFKSHGFATEWKRTGLILHPDILRYEYCGEIGEQAFKALMIHYVGVKESELVHLEGYDYELADFVIKNSDGSYKVAFDVKNMNPKCDHTKSEKDMPESVKRKEKRERLHCRLFIVNVLKTNEPPIDSDEIGGLINEDGTLIPNSVELLRKIIKDL